MNERPDELMRVSTSDGKYTVVSPRNEQLRIDRYGEPWMGPGFQGSNAVLALAGELDDLRQAARDLYMAGRWSCDRDCDEAALWTALRDAAGIPEGTATTASIGDAA